MKIRVLAWPVLGLLIGCGPSGATARAPEVAGAGTGLSTRGAAADRLSPFIAEWPGTSKVALDNASQRGLVVVSYGASTLKLLPDCRAAGSYAFRGVTPVRDAVVVASETELEAKLPFAVATLKGDLAASGRLSLDYVAVGQREAQGAPSALEGQCAGATHFVRAITVGAYALYAGAASRVGAGASVGNAGVSGGQAEHVDRLRGSGDVAKCSASGAPVPECMAVIQLRLMALPRGLAPGGGAPEEPEPDEAAPSRGLAPWLVTGAGVLVLGAGATLGGLALKSYGDANTACPSHTGCSQTALDARSRAGTFAKVADVGVPLGIVGTGIGVVLFAVGGPKAPASARLPIRLDFGVGATGATGVVGGSF
jgi:hypothetical protein